MPTLNRKLSEILGGEYGDKKRRRLKEDIIRGVQPILSKLREEKKLWEGKNPYGYSLLDREDLIEDSPEGLEKEVSRAYDWARSDKGKEFLEERGLYKYLVYEGGTGIEMGPIFEGPEGILYGFFIGTTGILAALYGSFTGNGTIFLAGMATTLADLGAMVYSAKSGSC